MALDTKQKRGSAALAGMPFRTWACEPGKTGTAGGRQAAGHYCSAAADGAPGTVVPGPYYSDASSAFTPGSVASKGGPP